MSNIPILPLVSSTPPPMDFDDLADADSGAPSALPDDEDDDFGDFAAVAEAVDDDVDVASLPTTPIHSGISASTTTTGYIDLPPPYNENVFLENYSPPPLPAQSTAISMVQSANAEIRSTEEGPTKLAIEGKIPSQIKLNTTVVDEKCFDDDIKDAYDSDSNVHDENYVVKTGFQKKFEFDEFDENDSEAKYDDNTSLPSLKLDTLSITSKGSPTPVFTLDEGKIAESGYCTDMLSACQVVENAPDVERQQRNPDDVNSTGKSFTEVKLEDVYEENATGFKNEEFDENSTDFFAIYSENDALSHKDLNITSSKTESNKFDHIEEKRISENAATDDDECADEFTDFEAFSSKEEEVISSPSNKAGDEEFVFKADFSELEAENADAIAHAVGTTMITGVPQQSWLEQLDDDDFDDFQDFVTEAAVEPSKLETTSTNVGEKLHEAVSELADDDDDFGEFNDVVAAPLASASSYRSAPDMSFINLEDKLQPILQVMFPVLDDPCSPSDKQIDYDVQSNRRIELTSAIELNQIDLAKALDYQWSASEVRHSLIKALGIDSRNILFGEKWNSSVPRFAANSSFNPLKPMKPDKVDSQTGSTLHPPSMKLVSSPPLKASSGSVKGVKTEVPEVEFDWNSSGLVNPLDGVREILHERAPETFYPAQPRESDASSDKESYANNIITSDHHCQQEQQQQQQQRSQVLDLSAVLSQPTATAGKATVAEPPFTISTNNGSHCSANLTIEIPVSILEAPLGSSKPSDFGVIDSDDPKDDDNSEEMDSDVNVDCDDVTCDVVTTSKFAGPLKETHIFTPSKGENVLSSRITRTPKTSESSKQAPIDFDYEMAATGIIIDEKVVKKEYRDVEYDPGFGLEVHKGKGAAIEGDIKTVSDSKPADILDYELGEAKAKPLEVDSSSSLINEYLATSNIPAINVAVDDFKQISTVSRPWGVGDAELDEEFSDFQSVPAPVAAAPISTVTSSPSGVQWPKSVGTSRTVTPVSMSDEMILSPAVLLPQAIQIDSTPKIEWPEPGINPIELARIEELFPQAKTKSPSHNGHGGDVTANKPLSNTAQLNSLSISETIANHDDDWSDFVSVPLSSTNSSSVQQFQKNPYLGQKNQMILSPQKYEMKKQHTNFSSSFSTNDDDWSDFVSSVPVTQQQKRTPAGVYPPALPPQFNSAAWKNANFYNNPLSYYQQQNSCINVVPNKPTTFTAHANNYQQQQQTQHNSATQSIQKTNSNNNNNQLNNNNTINQYLVNSHHSKPQLYQEQQIHIMHDFSATSSSSYHDGYGAQHNLRMSAGNVNASPTNKSTIQFGSAKTAPCISLIPDLGFIAPPPAAAAHTTYISSLPRTNFTNPKK